MFLLKHILDSPSYSSNAISGRGTFGVILTTLDSTCGGGLKLFLPTFIICSTLAYICAFTLNQQYNASLGLTTSLNANSL